MTNPRIVLTKIWRITTANALSLSGGLSLLHFVSSALYPIALGIVLISFGVYFTSSYRQFGDLPAPFVEPWSIRTILRRIWIITLNNILAICGGLTYLFFVLGTSVLKLTLLIVSGYVLMYIDSYRTLRAEEHAAAMAPPPELPPEEDSSIPLAEDGELLNDQSVSDIQVPAKRSS
ncbi:MAG: hypothetical protein RLY87_1721 [Chloroflexota bacterium]